MLSHRRWGIAPRPENMAYYRPVMARCQGRGQLGGGSVCRDISSGVVPNWAECHKGCSSSAGTFIAFQVIEAEVAADSKGGCPVSAEKSCESGKNLPDSFFTKIAGAIKSVSQSGCSGAWSRQGNAFWHAGLFQSVDPLSINSSRTFPGVRLGITARFACRPHPRGLKGIFLPGIDGKDQLCGILFL